MNRHHKKKYGIKPTHIEDVSDLAAVVICVKHKAYQELGLETIKNLFKRLMWCLILLM